MPRRFPNKSIRNMPLTECNSDTTQNLQFEVSPTMELKNVTSASDNAGKLVG